MAKLTKTQIDLLIAAQTDNGAAMPKGSAPAALIKLGLLISIPRDGEVSRLMITSEGKALLESTTDKPPSGRDDEAPVTPLAEDTAAAIPKGKIGSLIALLRRPEGAGIQEMQDATGWQAHSVRGAIAGSVKKKLGLTVTSTKSDAGRVYRIVEGAGA